MKLNKWIYKYSFLIFSIYLIASLFAFWPLYFSRYNSVPHKAIHFHGLFMWLWLLLLLTQSLLIRSRQFWIHKKLGISSFVLAPFVAFSLVIIAHVSLNRFSIEGIRYAQLALQLSYFPLFLITCSLGFIYRKDRPRHAKFMICTILPMTSPIFDRVLGFYFFPTLKFIPNFVDGSRLLFLIYVFLIVFSIWDWRSNRALNVFPTIILLFLFQHIFVLFSYKTQWWETFAHWFVNLPIS